MSWSLARHPEWAFQLAGSLMFILISRGMIGIAIEVRPWLEGLIEKSDNLYSQKIEAIYESEIARVRAHSALAGIYIMEGNYLKGRRAAERAVALARRSEVAGSLANALSVNALVVALEGERERSIILADKAISLIREHDSDWSFGWTLVNATPNFGFAGDPRAQILIGEISLFAKKTGNPLLTAFASFGQSSYALDQGNHELALSLFKESLARFKEIGDRVFPAIIRSEIAHIMRQTGKEQEADMIYRESILAWHDLGHRAAIAHQLECFAYLALAAGELTRASKLLGAAAGLRESAKSPRRGSEQVEFEQAVKALQTQLNEINYGKAFELGREMSMESAIGFAVG